MFTKDLSVVNSMSAEDIEFSKCQAPDIARALLSINCISAATARLITLVFLQVLENMCHLIHLICNQ